MSTSQSTSGHPTCAFCEIILGRRPASIVLQDDDTVAFLDLRQFHPGHILVVPREHVRDIRDINIGVASTLLATVVRVSRAVAAVFPGEGLSVWHSAGEGANQEVPHLHFHVHPRFVGDDLLRVYPSPPPSPPREILDTWAQRLRAAIS